MIAIFGGTFDPVHFGHLRAAVEARECLDLDHLTLLPAGTPPHRDTPFAPASDRLRMLQLAVNEHSVNENSGLLVDDREVRRQGYSWMVDTLAEFRAQSGPEQPLALLLGQDAVNQLDSWKEWRRLFDLAHIIIMRRPDSGHDYSSELYAEIQSRRSDDKEQLRQQASGLVLALEVTQLAISSTGIRQLLQQGKSCRFLLPEAVLAYIEQAGLYRTTPV